MSLHCALRQSYDHRIRDAIALTYPRKHLIGEIFNHIWNFGFFLFRSDFRGFVHDPQLVQQLIETRGFHRVFNHDSMMWHTQVYVSDSISVRSIRARNNSTGESYFARKWRRASTAGR